MLIEAAIAEVDLLPAGASHRGSHGPRSPRASARPVRVRHFYVASGVTWQVRTQDLERGEVTAYQDGVWLGRAIRARGRERAGRGAADEH